MPRYIDVDALLESLKNFTYAEPCTEFQRGVNAVVPLILSEIKHFPLADVAPRAEVAREAIDVLCELHDHFKSVGDIREAFAMLFAIVELKKKYTEDVK